MRGSVWLMVAILASAACGSSSSPVDASTTPAFSCTPGESLCNDEQLWSCNLSGHDATHVASCAALGTATNPATCATTGCPGGEAACCKRMDAGCSYAITSPVALSGGSCNAPAVTQNATCGRFTTSIYVIPAPAPGVCASDLTQVIVSLDRTAHAAGSTFAPVAADSIEYIGVSGGTQTSCSAWTGNVHWVSDVPAWQVDVDLTCTTGTLHLVGSLHGTL
jgi:hypothetical protein